MVGMLIHLKQYGNPLEANLLASFAVSCYILALLRPLTVTNFERTHHGSVFKPVLTDNI